jgi:Domain of unknown function (DUF4148)
MNTKSIVAFVLATVIAAPAFADGDIHYPDKPATVAAQSGRLARSQVRAELVQLEKAGYNPTSDETQYPKNIQAAESRVSAQDEEASSYGGVAGGSSASGAPAAVLAGTNDGSVAITVDGRA